MTELDQTPTSEIVETPTDAGLPVTDAPVTSETETDEEKNARVQAEDAERARKKEEKRQQTIDRRFAELTAEKHQARKQVEEMMEQNKKLLSLIEGKQAPASTTEGEPKREQFAEYEDYVTARAEYRAEQKAKALIADSMRQQQTEAEMQSKRTAAENERRQFVEQRAKLKTELPDFDEAVAAWEPKLPDNVATMVMKLPEGPLLSYHMAKNPALEAKFEGQPEYMHGVILGQIIASLKSPAKVTAAPAPGTPVGTKSAPNDGDYSGPPEGYYAWAMKQQKAGKLR